MGEAEQQRQHNRGRPEAHARGKRELKITPEGKFFPEANDHEGRGPGSCGGEDGHAVNRNAGEVKSVESEDGKKAGADGEEAYESPNPEIPSKRGS